MSIEEFSRIAAFPLRRGITGAQSTTIAIGGAFELLAEPHSVDELLLLYKASHETGVALHFLGAGSNLLVSDSGVSGCVVRLGRGFKAVTKTSETTFEVGAGYSLMRLSKELSESGHSGLEFAGGIPASLGGATKMNAGAHGGEMSQLLSKVWVTTPDSDGEVQLSPESLNCSYRHTSLPRGACVTRVALKLVSGDAQRSTLLRGEYLAERKRRQPLALPSAGSIFKNPEGARSAGALIEAGALKGVMQGGAQISPLHANWIVNPSRTATAADVELLMQRAQGAVSKLFGVELHPELVRW